MTTWAGMAERRQRAIVQIFIGVAVAIGFLSAVRRTVSEPRYPVQFLDHRGELRRYRVSCFVFMDISAGISHQRYRFNIAYDWHVHLFLGFLPDDIDRFELVIV
ncbi:hypothetical protein [Methylorubrum populi]